MTATAPQNGTAPAAPAPIVRRNPTLLEFNDQTERYRLALEPTTPDEGWEIAQAAAASALTATPDEAYARILIGRPLGIPAMASIQGIALVENQKTGLKTPCMYAKLKLALLQSRKDVIEYIRPKKLGDDEAIWVAKRVGPGEEPIEYRFTIEDARVAGLVGRGDGRTNSAGASLNNYDRHPGPMLQWRACGRLCDIIGADVLNSLATREDIEDEERSERELRAAAEAATRGQIPAHVPAPPQAAATPARDFAAEAEALKQEISDAVGARDRDRIKAMRETFKRFSAEAPKDLVDECQRFYNMTVGEAKKVAPAPAPTPTPAPTQPRGQYLPPEKRGDAYDGPDFPEPPFGQAQ